MRVEDIFGQLSIWIWMLNFCLLLLPRIYPMFTFVDQNLYSKYGSGSTKFLNIDPLVYGSTTLIFIEIIIKNL